jgi:transposase
MGRKVKQLKNYSTEQVEKVFESDERHRTGIKLYAILQLTRGYSSRALEKIFRVSFKQICNWADRFDAEGIDGLRIRPGRGRRTRLTIEQIHQLKADLSKSPQDFDYNSAIWSGPLICEHIREAYQVDYKLSAVYSLMRKTGFSFRQESQIG